METCWQILGIAPTTDINVIKEAYSVLAKKNNPEDDPEGFRKIHDAYKSAMDYARGRASAMPEIFGDDDEDEEELPEIFAYNGSAVIDDITEFKKLNKLDSLRSVTVLQPHSRLSFISELQRLYLKLYELEKTEEVWQEFLKEPIVKPLLFYRDVRSQITTQALGTSKSILEGLLIEYEGYADLFIKPVKEPKQRQLKTFNKKHTFITGGVLIIAGIFFFLFYCLLELDFFPTLFMGIALLVLGLFFIIDGLNLQ